MATYFLWSGAGGAGTGADWTNAFTTYTAALAAATASGDIIKVHKTHQDTISASITYTHQNHISVICVDKDASDAPSEMGASYWIGHNSTTYPIAINGAFRVYLYGITFRVAGASAASLALNNSDGGHFEYENCLFWFDNTSAAAITRGVLIGNTETNAFTRWKNCTLRYNAGTVNNMKVSGRFVMEGGSLSSAGGATATFIEPVMSRAGLTEANIVGADLSHFGSANLLGNATGIPARANFSQCKLGSGYVMLATQTLLNRSSAEIYVFDCFGGTADDASEHGRFAYANAMGSIVSDDVIKLSAGAAGQSWKITTTGYCSYYTPFETPWISLYNTGTSAIEPYLEFLRNNDSTSSTYDNDEVWIDVMAKTTADSTASTLYTDRMALLGSPAAQTSSALGAGDWAGESGTCAYGVIKAPSLTPAENGHIMARVCVGIEIAGKLHVDPQIRT
jgi:hypothetical protein